MLRILYVDDEPSLLDIGKLFLEESGDFTVTNALSAPEAIWLLGQEKFDCIVSDYQMPKMDGIQFLVEVRKRFGQIPFILFTGRGREEVVIQALNEGADFYLQKGGEPEAQFAELSHKIKRAVGSWKAEEELRLKNLILSTEEENSLDAILIVDKGGNILNYNRQFTALWGIPDDLIAAGVDEPVLQYVVGQVVDPEAFFSRVRYLYDHRDEKSFHELRLKDGRTLERFSAPMFGKGREYYGRVWYFRNITERRQAEDALRESERRMREIIDNAPFGAHLYELKPEGQLVFIGANRAADLILNVKNQQFIGKTIEEAFPPLSQTDIPDAYRRVAATGGQYDGDQVDYADDGGIRGAFEVHASQTGPNRMATFFRDITERKRIEEQLRESEAKYRRIIETANEGVWVVDRNLNTSFVNQRFADMLGYSLGEMTGHNLMDYVVNDDRTVMETQIVSRRKGIKSSYECKLLHKDGSTVWSLISGSPFLDNTGTFQGSFGMITDINERKIAEKALADSKHQLDAMAANIPGVIYRVSIRPDGTLGFDYISRRCRQILGIENDPATFFERITGGIVPENRELFFRSILEAVSTKTLWQFESQYVRPGEKETIWLSGVSNPVMENDTLIFDGVIFDITDRKRAEQAKDDAVRNWQSTFDSTPDGICLLDRDQRIIRCNHAMQEILSVENGNHLIGQHCWEAVRGTVGQISDCPHLRMQKSPHRETMDLKIGDRYFIITLDPILDGTKTLVGAVHSMRDITEHKRAEEALCESENKYRSIVEQSVMGVGISKGNQVIFANKALLRIFNYDDLEEFKKIPLLDHVAPSSYQFITDRLKIFAEGKTPASEFEYDIIDKGGVSKTLHATSTRISTEGEVYTQTTFQDITERKWAEAALRESEARFRTIFNSTFEFMALLDPDGSILTVNESALMFGGFSLQDVLHKPFWEARWWSISSEIQDRLKDAIIRVEAGEFVRYEVNVLGYDNRVITVDFSLKPVRIDSGIITSLVAEGRDITERKRAEKTLHESEARFDQLARQSKTVTWEVDARGLYTYVSHVSEDVWGYRPDELVGRMHYYDLHPEPGREEFRQATLAVFDRKEPFRDLENVIQTGDGQAIWVLTNGIPVLNPDGSLHGYRGNDTEITERRRADDALRESEARLSSIIRVAPVGIGVVSNRIIQTANDRLCQISGYTLDELIGKSARVLYPTQEEFDYVGRKKYTQIAQKGSGSVETRWQKKDGTIIDILLSSTPLNPSDLSAGVTFTALDITERKRAEKLLHESENKFSSVFYGSPVALTLVSATDGTFVNVNDTFLRTTGYTRDEVLGTSSEALGIFAAEREREHLASSLRDHHIVEDMEIHCRIKTGEIRPCLFSSGIILIGGRPHILSTVRDITDRKRAEEALEKYIVALTQPLEDTGIAFEELFNIDEIQHVQDQFAKAMGVASVITDTDGTPITKPSNFTHLCNDIIRKTGRGCSNCYKSDAIIGRFHPDGPIVQPCLSGGLWDAGASIVVGGRHIANWLIGQVRNEAQNDEMMRAYAREIGADEHTFLDAFHEVPSMSYEKFEAIAQSLYTLANQLSKSAYQNVQQARFITERKKTEEALKQSEIQLAEALNLAQVVNWEFDVASGIFTFNDRFYALYGTTAELEGGYQMPAEVYAQKFVHPDDQYLVADQVKKAIQTTDPDFEPQVEHRIIRLDGEIRHIIVRIRITKDKNGRTVRTHGANQDITNRKLAEEAIFQANRKLTLLSSITRHDINNQVTVLMGYLRILNKKQPDPSLREYFEKAAMAARRISAMIEFTREYESIGVKTPIWQNCRTLVDTLTKQAPLGNVIVKNDLPVDGEVFADPLVVKVFYNLMDNAVRYGGKITEIRFSVEESGNVHLIICEDDGDGVLAEDKENIFERGFGKNTGLGLTLSREILDITGITIRETGDPGKGARFEMTVPKGMWRVAGK